jgi:translocation and assembly module TamB
LPPDSQGRRSAATHAAKLPTGHARNGSASLDLGLDSGSRRLVRSTSAAKAWMRSSAATCTSASAGHPSLRGGFNLLRGDYKLVGQTLRFTTGRIGFDGAEGFNANLDLEARVNAANSTAILAVLGTVESPCIVLRSEPELPQDEVLSRLLFGSASGRLSAVQATRLGMAAAGLAGIGKGEGFVVLERARTGLGLDRLSVDTDEKGGATLEGGRYLSEGVYLGARQGSRSGETQGVLRIEVTPQVRLEADVGGTGGTRGGLRSRSSTEGVCKRWPAYTADTRRRPGDRPLSARRTLGNRRLIACLGSSPRGLYSLATNVVAERFHERHDQRHHFRAPSARSL